ncbi:MAG: SDR family NAD(P)-dependent oxidoreductase [Dehalococcoidia bacterium]
MVEPAERASRGGRLAGKVAIVTGAGSRGPGTGNGRATAILFAREGARVVLADQVLERAEETLAAIETEGGQAYAWQADVTQSGECRALVEEAVRRYGRLDILDNNVGIEGGGTVVQVDEDTWDRVMQVNVKSMMLMSKFAIPAMLPDGGGSIINISSISALRPRGLTPYSTSKGAIIALTRAMAIDHAREGVRVNCIAPGPVYTPMVAGGMTAERRERRRLASPLGIEGSAWDIAWAAVYLASDEARYVTGVVLPVDGGVTITSSSR